MDQEWKQAANEFEKLINTGKITWQPLNIDNLPGPTRLYVKTILMPAIYQGLKVQVAKERINGTVLFKLDGLKHTKYLHHDGKWGHQYADEGFHNAINNNLALAELLEIIPTQGKQPQQENQI